MTPPPTLTDPAPGSPTALPGAASRSVELDFLRGIAILLVMGVHYSLPHTGIAALDWIASTLKLVGGTGVNLFFTLSGFLVGGLLLKEYKKTGRVRPWRFLGRRAFKIWPPLYVLIFFHLVIAHHPRSSFFWQNFFQIQNYVGSSLNQTWSLAVEEHFYLFLTFLLVLLIGRTPRFIITTLSVLCLCAITARVTAVHYGMLDPAFRQTHFRIDSLLYGVILAAVSTFYPEKFAALGRQRALLVGSAIFLAVFIYNTSDKPVIDRDLGYMVQGIGYALLIVLVYVHCGKLAQQLWFRGIARIGIYSYGIYLWHTLALEPGHKLISMFAARGVPAVLSWFVIMAVQVGIALIIGIVMTRLVEWPSLWLREKYLGHEKFELSKRPEPAASER